MSFANSPSFKTFVTATAIAGFGVCAHGQTTQTQNIVNAPIINGTTLVIGANGQLQAGARALSGSAGGATIKDGIVHVENASTGNVTNAARHNGDATVITTGATVLRAVSVTGGARTGDITNAPQRNGSVTAVAGGLEGSVSPRAASASTTGSVTIDAVKVCGGTTGNITNAGQVNGKATYVGGHVMANSVTVGCS